MDKSQEKCRKCSCVPKNLTSFVRGGEEYKLCPLCAKIVNRSSINDAIWAFLHEDHGNLKMTDVERSILDARIDRAKGKFKWIDLNKDDS